MPQSTFDKVVDLWNSVIESHNIELKIENINIIKELIIFKEPSLLDNFYEEILGLLIEKFTDVKVTAIDFIETACKTDVALLHKSLIRLQYLVEDESFAVLKKMAAAMMTIYRLCLTQAVRNKGSIAEDVESFQLSIFIVEELIKKIDSPNGGFILMLIKLIESIIILQSKRSQESEIPKMRESEMSLDQISENMPCTCLNISRLEQYGIRLFNILINMLKRDNCSSSHVHTLLTSLTNIGRQRPQFLNRVIEGFELTHVNMSDRLGEVQVNSIRKALKSNLMILLKLPGCQEFQSAISTLLTDLGATQQEISRYTPKTDETSRKRKKRDEIISSSSKRSRAAINGTSDSPSDFSYNDSVIRRFAPTQSIQKSVSIKSSDNYVEQMSKELIPKLNVVINVTDLVLLSMMMLPDTMPPAFQSAYTPIAAAGTNNQIAHLSRLLANQLISAGYYSLESKEKREPQEADMNDPSLLENFNIAGNKISSGHLSISSKKQLQRQFNLVSVTKTLSPGILRRLTQRSYERILSMPLLDNMFERSRANTHTSSMVAYSSEISNLPKWYFARNKILTSLPSSIFGGAELYVPLVNYCLSDIKNKFDILTSLIMQEFIRYKAFHLAKPKNDNDTSPCLATLADYDIVLVSVLNNLITSDVKETYFGRMLLEAPLLTSNALETLRAYCSVKVNAEYGFQIVRELMNTRPDQRKQLLTLILDFSSDENTEIRTAALKAAKWILIVSHQYADEVLEFAKSNLQGLLLPRPSTDIYPLRKLNIPLEWNEEIARSCLYLFLSLIPSNHSLIHLLAEVFVSTCQAIKRTILKMIDIPVKEMGMDSEEILNMVENCNHSQEIVLITRIIYILTDKLLPSPILVEKIKNLYHNKYADVRLFVPILKGLTKAEIIELLPKFVVINDKVVSEVFRRLLDVAAYDPVKGDFIVHTSPILPEELLIAVHQLEFDNISLKYIIEASKMCFKEKQIFTQERLAIVIGHMIELPVIPTLFMRTLMQSFSMYPRMVGYVVNVLARLIKKQVWKNSSLWEGFIRCCMKLKEHSFPVLLQLPVDKLELVFNSMVEFRVQIREYIENGPQKQKHHISSAVLNLINNEPAVKPLTIQTRVEAQPVISNSNTQELSPIIVAEKSVVVTSESTTIVSTASSIAPSPVVVKTEKLSGSSLVKAVMDKEKLEEERKKKERAKQILVQENKISFLPAKADSKSKGSTK